MTEQRIGTREDWLRAREALLAKEKELTRRSDELASERRALPWVPIEKAYRFETEAGPKTLTELFDGRSQLLVYHFMFGPNYSAGCPVCSSGADTYDGAVEHLNARDITFLCASRAPLERVLDYRERMGWHFPWVQASDEFNADFGVLYPREALEPFLQSGDLGVVGQFAADCGVDPAAYITEAPGLSAFALHDGVVHQTYATSARGLEVMLGFYGLLDRVAKGRDEGPDGAAWIRRHDEY